MTLPKPQQLAALLALILAIVVVGETPVIISGMIGRTLSDALIAMSDKTVTGLVGVLGTIAGLIFRQSATDEQSTLNTGEAFKAIAAAQAAPAPQSTITKASEQPISVSPASEGN